jgi:4-amino-4-deoxy-L-arabinose transferase-like glycosyltransferase
MSATTGVWAFILLDRTPDWLPPLRWVVLVSSIAAASVIAVGAHRLGKATAGIAVAAVLIGIAAPAAYAIDTVVAHHDGPMPTSGPATAGLGPEPGMPGGARGDNAALQALVKDTESRWAAASIGSMTASSLELSTGTSIMAIGGFTGSDNSPTLQQFERYVADRQIHYFIADERLREEQQIADRMGPQGPQGNRTGSASDITAWVKQHFTPMDVGGTTVYDLFAPTR